MLQNLGLLISFTLPLAAEASQLSTSTFSPGSARSASPTGSILDGALDPSGGELASTPNYQLKPGFIGNLYDVVSLRITTQEESVEENESNGLFTEAVMDDGTILEFNPSEVTWTVVQGPVKRITEQGLAEIASAHEDMITTIRGTIAGVEFEVSFNVISTGNDNDELVGGDGIDDGWQLQFFDSNSSQILDAEEAIRAVAGADGDGDSQNNILEYLSGYNPADGSSYLLLEVIEKSGNRVTLRISKVVPGTRYHIEKSTDLEQSDPFTRFTSFTPDKEEADFQFFDETPNSGTFYRAILEAVP